MGMGHGNEEARSLSSSYIERNESLGMSSERGKGKGKRSHETVTLM